MPRAESACSESFLKPHGPGPCVRRLGTLPTRLFPGARSHIARDRRGLRRPGFVALQETDSKPHWKSPISNTKMVGGPGHYLNSPNEFAGSFLDLIRRAGGIQLD
jgi:hypothetical protein